MGGKSDDTFWSRVGAGQGWEPDEADRLPAEPRGAPGLHLADSAYRILPLRAGALIMDGIVWIALFIAYGMAFGTTVSNDQFVPEGSGGFTITLGPNQTSLVTAIWLLSLIASECLLGATLGKLACGLRVVRSDGQPADAKATALRHLPRLAMLAIFALLSAPMLVPSLFIVESLIALTHERRQRLGDRLADIIVVRRADLTIALREHPASGRGGR